MASSLTPNVLNLEGQMYNVERVLGRGAFGEVLKVKCAGSGGVYALKKILVENEEAVDMVKREIGILRGCNHNHIVNIYTFGAEKISQSNFMLILMEYCEGGNLNRRLVRPSDDEINLRWMRELADAICYLHSSKIVHRDLKPENVLLTAYDSIKLGDFGLAREYAALKQANATRSDETLLSYMTTVYMDSKLGTPGWMAPEVFEGHYTEKADIFSLGTIFYAILERQYLYISGEKYYGAFVNVNGQMMGLGKAMTRDLYIMVSLDGMSLSKRDLVRSMLARNPRDRPTTQKVLEDVNEFA